MTSSALVAAFLILVAARLAHGARLARRARPSPRPTGAAGPDPGPGAAAAAPTASDAAASDDVLGSFSIVSMFMRADIVVKAVMILLLLASLWSWAIIFNKWLALADLKRKARASSRKMFWSGQSLDELYQQFAATQRSSHGGDVRRGAARMAPRLRRRRARAKASSPASRSASTRR